MSADAGIFMHESRLLRAPHSLNRRLYSQSGLSPSLLIPACPYHIRVFAHASMAHSRLPSGAFIVNHTCFGGGMQVKPIVRFRHPWPPWCLQSICFVHCFPNDKTNYLPVFPISQVKKPQCKPHCAVYLAQMHLT